MDRSLVHVDAPAEVEGSEVEDSRVVLILCGLIASGKSTFAEALQEHFPKFRRCNQDDLGSRKAVEKAAREALRSGYSICVDRTNFDTVQRSHWIKIAHEFPGTVVWVIVFDTPFEICVERLRKRTSHPTIKSAEEGLPILARFANDFRHPDPREGYDHILYLQPPASSDPNGSASPISDTLNYGVGKSARYQYTKSEISSILQQIRNSPVVLSPQSNLTSASRSDPSDISANSLRMSGPAPNNCWRKPGRGSHTAQRSGNTGHMCYGSHDQQGSIPGLPYSQSYASASSSRQAQYRRGRGNWRAANWRANNSAGSRSSGEGLGRDGGHEFGASGES